MKPSSDIQAFLDADQKKDLLRLLTAGSVDDGKSTLIGRLLFDSKQIYKDHLATLERDSKRIGHAGEEIDYALLLDGLKAEREQGITIDVAYRYFSTNKRKFIIADTPGHEQYTRNMVTGASTANLAIILIDARKGVITQTKRHSFLVSLLGIKHVVVAVNKMDLKNYSQQVFNNICEEYKIFASKLDIPDIQYFPISALKGDNIVDKSENMPWFFGTTLLDFLEKVQVSSDRNFIDMRYPVQFVNRPNINFRGFAATVASGIVKIGEEIISLPSGQKSRIKEIVTYDGNLQEAFPPQSVTITLDDEIDASRGDMLVYPDNLPLIGQHFESMLVWMDESPMDKEMQFFIKHANNMTRAFVQNLDYKIDVNTMEHSNISSFNLNDIGKVRITTAKPLFFDPYKANKVTGSFILIDPITNYTCAVGMILGKSENSDAASKNTLGKLYQSKDSQDAEVKYHQQKLKGKTTIRLDAEAQKSNLGEVLEKEILDKLVEMLINEGVDVVQ